MSARPKGSVMARIYQTVRASYGATPDITDAAATELFAREVVWRALERAGAVRSRQADRAIRFIASMCTQGADPGAMSLVVRDVARIASGVRPLPMKKPHLVWRNGRMFIATGAKVAA